MTAPFVPQQGNIFNDLLSVGSGIAAGSITRRRERESAAREAALQADREKNTAISQMLAKLQAQQLEMQGQQGKRTEDFRNRELKQRLTELREGVTGRQKVAEINAGRPTNLQAGQDLNEAQGEINRLVAGFDLPGETQRLQTEAQVKVDELVQQPTTAPGEGIAAPGGTQEEFNQAIVAQSQRSPLQEAQATGATPEQLAAMAGIDIPSEQQIRLDYIDQLADSMAERFKGRVSHGEIVNLVMTALEERFGAIGAEEAPGVSGADAAAIAERLLNR